LELEGYRLRYLVSALFILALAVYQFSIYSVSTSQQSTFDLLPGFLHELTITTRDTSDTVSGQFQETSGHPVSFYILTSAQYAAYQSGTSFDYVYSVIDSTSSTISYTFSTQDTYSLVFRHGTGLVNTTETVYFQRTYATHNTFALTLGLIFIVLVAADVVFAFRSRKPKPSEEPPPMGYQPDVTH
jgi:hypothetical protein